MEAGSKYDPTKNNEITLKYISEPSFILDYGLRGMSLGDAMKYFEQNNIKYELLFGYFYPLRCHLQGPF